MKAGIYTNKDKDLNYSLTKHTAKLLKSFNVEVFFSSTMKESFFGENFFEFEDKSIDILLVFGGDGTILGVAEKCAKADIPILGINLGSLGFMTEIENDRLENSLKMLIENSFSIEQRSLLEAVWDNNHYYALNDIVFLKDVGFVSAKKLVQFEVYANNSLVDNISADGLIVSTPTGSTAYSLSAGGPILSPKITATLITAICPHSLHFRPLVLCDSEEIEIKLCGITRVGVAVDGYNKFNMIQNQSLKITKSDLKAKFIRFNDTNFYRKLRNKLNKWSNSSF